MTDQEKIKEIRKSIVSMVHNAGVSHIGAAFSIIEILYVLYFKAMKLNPSQPQDPTRDIFVLSKGHASAALYATLAHRGYFPIEDLMTYCVEDGKLPGHLDKDSCPGVEVSAGSLGHGAPVALGMALARSKTPTKDLSGKAPDARLARSPGGAGPKLAVANEDERNAADGPLRQIYTLVGDGECNEGSIWEMAMLAPNLGLNNFTVIIDYNKIQSFGNTNDIIDQSNLVERWASFGWDAVEIDGHNLEQIEQALSKTSSKPKAIVAHTTKGKGVSFMEDQLLWHYKSPNDEQYKQALEELS
ncbi:MAG: transketolase [Candidatus Melainabacteria bacterium]|nr:transketolase [Candidatus Melainabacteria bacterium]